MGKYPNLMYSSSPLFNSNDIGQEFGQIHALLEQLTVNMDQRIWPTADDVEQSNRDAISSASSSRRSSSEKYFDTVDSVIDDSKVGISSQLEILVEDNPPKSNYGNKVVMHNNDVKENYKKYSREFLLSVNEIVKDKPFRGMILYPCVLRSHVDPPRVPANRYLNGHIPRFGRYGGQNIGFAPPPLFPLITLRNP